ncbi:hypothetical protein SEVIR_1G192666v4 [Setaria viridis]
MVGARPGLAPLHPAGATAPPRRSRGGTSPNAPPLLARGSVPRPLAAAPRWRGCPGGPRAATPRGGARRGSLHATVPMGGPRPDLALLVRTDKGERESKGKENERRQRSNRVGDRDKEAEG